MEVLLAHQTENFRSATCWTRASNSVYRIGFSSYSAVLLSRVFPGSSDLKFQAYILSILNANKTKVFFAGSSNKVPE